MNLIYRLQFKSGDTYVGSTTNLTNRLAVFRHNRVGTCSAALHQAIAADPQFEVHVVACALGAGTMHEVEAAIIRQEHPNLNFMAPTPNKARPHVPPQMRQRIIQGKTINQWAKEMGVHASVLHSRIHMGWSEQEVLGQVKRDSQIRKEMAEEERQRVLHVREHRRRRRVALAAQEEQERRKRNVELIQWLERTGVQL